MKRLLFVCTQNACRSQMAEAICNEMLEGRAEAFSAGVDPATVHPLAIEAISELGIETSGLRSKHMDEFKGQPFDLVVTVCSNARDGCPYWPGQGRRIHFGLEDPALARGSEAERLRAFRRVRDRIVSELIPFLAKELKIAGG